MDQNENFNEGSRSDNYEGHRWFIQTRNIVYYVLGVLEVILLFRLLFRLLGANPNSSFVSFIYNLSRIFVAPFYGIFSPLTADGGVAQSVFEPATVVAMIVYAVIARGIVGLLKLRIAENVR